MLNISKLRTFCVYVKYLSVVEIYYTTNATTTTSITISTITTAMITKIFGYLMNDSQSRYLNNNGRYR